MCIDFSWQSDVDLFCDNITLERTACSLCINDFP